MQYQYADHSWKNNRLYLRRKSTKISLIPHIDHIHNPNNYPMFKIRFEDGTLSDYYNESRAKDNAIKYVCSTWNRIQDRARETGSVCV